MPGAEWLIAETDGVFCFFFLSSCGPITKTVHTQEEFVKILFIYLFFKVCWDLPGGSVVKNPASNEEAAGWILGWRSKIPYAMGQLSAPAATTEPESHTWQAYTPRSERSPRCSEVAYVPHPRPNAAVNT